MSLYYFSANSLRKVILAVIGLFLCPMSPHVNAAPYQTYDLTLYCGQTILLNCVHDGYNLYPSGTLKYGIYPPASCSVNITLDTTSAGCSFSNYFAIYFNVRILNMDTLDSITIREQSSCSKNWTVVKVLSGSRQSMFTNPTSVAQFMSRYALQPNISITFNKASNRSFWSDSLALDYTVIHQFSTTQDTYCSALGGYVQGDDLCQAGDRVVCPWSYVKSLDPDNPVLKIHDADQAVCSKGTGRIVGTVIGVYILIVFIITGIYAFLLSRRRPRRKYMASSVPAQHVSSVTLQVADPTSSSLGMPNPNYQAQL